MSQHPLDLTGETFGRLKVKERLPNSPEGNTRWLCECVCGNTVGVLTRSLRSNATRSCGCLRVDKIKARHSRKKGSVFKGRLSADPVDYRTLDDLPNSD